MDKIFLKDADAEKIKSLINEDNAIINFSKRESRIYDYFKKGKFENNNKGLCEWIKENFDGAFLYIAGFNDDDYFKYILERRGYVKNGILNRPEVVKSLSNDEMKLHQFYSFHNKIYDYVRKNTDLPFKDYLAKVLDIEYISGRNDYGKNTQEFIEFLKSKADKKGCLDSLTSEDRRSATKVLKKLYKNENFDERLPFLEQFVKAETDLYFSNTFKLESLSEIMETLKGVYPNLHVTGLEGYKKLYNKLRHARDSVMPGVPFGDFIEEIGKAFGMNITYLDKPNYPPKTPSKRAKRVVPPDKAVFRTEIKSNDTVKSNKVKLSGTVDGR